MQVRSAVSAISVALLSSAALALAAYPAHADGHGPCDQVGQVIIDPPGAGGGVINGTPWNDIIYGNDGNDTINGGGGRDVIFGGDGSDTITGGDCNDTIRGEAGNDRVAGNNGDDRLDGGANGVLGDLVNGGPGVDVCTTFEQGMGTC